MTATLRSAQDWLAALLALAILGYLVYTMLRPERF
jgi:K+-transporting ATPase KdpF subunit